jgi:hypothetical protein
MEDECHFMAAVGVAESWSRSKIYSFVSPAGVAGGALLSAGLFVYARHRRCSGGQRDNGGSVSDELSSSSISLSKTGKAREMADGPEFALGSETGSGQKCIGMAEAKTGAT